jgi:hypothetical protein
MRVFPIVILIGRQITTDQELHVDDDNAQTSTHAGYGVIVKNCRSPLQSKVLTTARHSRASVLA